MGNNVGDGGFAGAGRPPQYHAGYFAMLNGRAQNAAFTGKVLLPHQVVQGAGAYPFCKRLVGIHAGKVRKKWGGEQWGWYYGWRCWPMVSMDELYWPRMALTRGKSKINWINVVGKRHASIKFRPVCQMGNDWLL